MGSCELFGLGWPQTLILHISAFQIIGANILLFTNKTGIEFYSSQKIQSVYICLLNATVSQTRMRADDGHTRVIPHDSTGIGQPGSVRWCTLGPGIWQRRKQAVLWAAWPLLSAAVMWGLGRGAEANAEEAKGSHCPLWLTCTCSKCGFKLQVFGLEKKLLLES
jgi:hypothetical protein